MVPFWLPPVLALILGALYLFVEEGRWGLRLLVALLVVLSFVLHRQGGAAAALGLVLQVVVCIYVLIRLGFRS